MDICYSGGAIGADKAWGEIAEHFNHKVIHYVFKEHRSLCDNLIVLSDEDLNLADKYLQKANKVLLRKFPSKNKFTNSLLRRNYYQIKDSDTCYAIASIENNKVSGGTAWATTMFIQNRTGECYVLNQEDNNWYKFDRNSNLFLIMESLPPAPHGKWTGIGSRKITDKSIDRICELFDKDN